MFQQCRVRIRLNKFPSENYPSMASKLLDPEATILTSSDESWWPANLYGNCGQNLPATRKIPHKKRDVFTSFGWIMFCPFFCWGGLRFKPTNNKKQRDSILKICILRIILGIFFITLYFENFIHVVFGMFLHNFLEFWEIILLNIHFFGIPTPNTAISQSKNGVPKISVKIPVIRKKK